MNPTSASASLAPTSCATWSRWVKWCRACGVGAGEQGCDRPAARSPRLRRRGQRSRLVYVPLPAEERERARKILSRVKGDPDHPAERGDLAVERLDRASQFLDVCADRRRGSRRGRRPGPRHRAASLRDIDLACQSRISGGAVSSKSSLASAQPLGSTSLATDWH